MKRVMILLILLMLMAPATAQQVDLGSGNYYTISKKTPDSDCQEKPTLEERVKCRFDTRNLQDSVVELCDMSRNKQYCTETFAAADSRHCAILRPSKKAGCYRDVVLMSDINSASDQQRRYYAALLLFSLEGRVQEAADNKIISGLEAADVLTSIEEAAQAVLVAPKEDIIRELERAKMNYRKTIA